MEEEIEYEKENKEAKSLCDAGRIMRDKENRNNDYVYT